MNVNLADGTGPLEMYAFMDESGRCLGYGNIDDQGNLVQQLDCPDVFEEIGKQMLIRFMNQLKRFNR